MTAKITEPGIYDGVPELDYHSDRAVTFGPTLSASGAKTLRRSPRRFAWEREHGRPPKDAFDLGGLVHALVLKSGDERIRVLDVYDWRTKAAQESRKEMRAAGLTPVNRADLRQAAKIAAAVRRHPLAGAILAKGRPEVTMYWPSEVTLDDGTTHVVMCRGRIDWLRDDAIVDLKTYGKASGAEPDSLAKEAASYDYPMPAAHYSDGYEALTGTALPFLTITVETEEPYFITVTQYSPDDLETGRDRIEQAKAEFARRTLSGEWDDPPTIHTLTLPPWYAYSA